MAACGTHGNFLEVLPTGDLRGDSDADGHVDGEVFIAAVPANSMNERTATDDRGYRGL